MVCNPIRTARLKRGLSRAALGARLGVSERTIAYWETWRKLPDPERTAALRTELDLSEIELWRCLHRAFPKTANSRKGGPIW